jgi:acetyl-CoA acetyltransferase
MRDVAIVAAGMTRFGELWNASLRDLFVEASQQALTSAGADHLDAPVPRAESPCAPPSWRWLAGAATWFWPPAWRR